MSGETDCVLIDAASSTSQHYQAASGGCEYPVCYVSLNKRFLFPMCYLASTNFGISAPTSEDDTPKSSIVHTETAVLTKMHLMSFAPI